MHQEPRQILETLSTLLNLPILRLRWMLGKSRYTDDSSWVA